MVQPVAIVFKASLSFRLFGTRVKSNRCCNDVLCSLSEHDLNPIKCPGFTIYRLILLVVENVYSFVDVNFYCGAGSVVLN